MCALCYSISMNYTKAMAYARVSTLLGQDVENQLVGIRELAKGETLNWSMNLLTKGYLVEQIKDLA